MILLNFELRLGREDERIRYVSNFDANVSDLFWNEAKLITDIYLKNMNSFTGKENSRILFVIDGIRPNLYDSKDSIDITNSFWYKIRKYFISQATEKGFEVIDMQEKFKSDYSINKKRFEFKSDTHWNDIGHKIVYESIKQSDTWNKFFFLNDKIK